MGREPLPERIAPLTPSPCGVVVLCGISNDFSLLSPSQGQVVHALLTRAPLRRQPKSTSPFDLHVLGTPPAFVLSQDQTLELKSSHASAFRLPRAHFFSGLEFLLISKLLFDSLAGLPARSVILELPSPFLLSLVLSLSCTIQFSRCVCCRFLYPFRATAFV